MKLATRSFTVRFITPAFVGDAFQNGRWRTPPFKAELRRWWRVAYAKEKDFKVDVAGMWRDEALLLGTAGTKDDRERSDGAKKNQDEQIESRKSQVLLRLSSWNEGTLKRENWRFSVRSSGKGTNDMQTPPDLYLGYGPIVLGKHRGEGPSPRGQAPSKGGKQPTLKNDAAIAEEESAILRLAFPEQHAPLLERTFWLMHTFGALGGRCRNGWGSYELVPADGRGLQSFPLPLRDWEECLEVDWPHAIGEDGKGPLIWRTINPASKWEDVIAELAYVRWALRKHIKQLGPRGASPQFVHWLGYPVTRQGVKGWDNLRLPNMLRFKVRRTADGKFEGLVYHIPHLPPPAFEPGRADLEKTWEAVHRFLDDLPGILTRAPR